MSWIKMAIHAAATNIHGKPSLVTDLISGSTLDTTDAEFTEVQCLQIKGMVIDAMIEMEMVKKAELQANLKIAKQGSNHVLKSQVDEANWKALQELEKLGAAPMTPQAIGDAVASGHAAYVKAHSHSFQPNVNVAYPDNGSFDKVMKLATVKQETMETDAKKAMHKSYKVLLAEEHAKTLGSLV